MALSGPTLGSFVFATAANLAARLIRWLFALEQGGISTGRFFFPDRRSVEPGAPENDRPMVVCARVLALG